MTCPADSLEILNVGRFGWNAVLVVFKYIALHYILQYICTVRVLAMDKLGFNKRPKRDTPLTVRLPKATVDRLREIAYKHEVSQADVIEKLIETAYRDLGSKRK